MSNSLKRGTYLKHSTRRAAGKVVEPREKTGSEGRGDPAGPRGRREERETFKKHTLTKKHFYTHN